MHLTIHRGTNEIGGTCIELNTKNTGILLDFGMPLVDENQNEFDFNKFRNLQVNELIFKGVLPDIKGLYSKEKMLME
jgi:ribonuclease J